MKCFRYNEDRVPVALFVALFVADLLVYWLVEHWILVAIWMLVGLTAKTFIAAWNHHHQHVHTFYQAWLNRLLEIVYTFHTGITTNLWVLHHNLGHHLHYLDQDKDESRWKRRDGARMGAFEYTIVLALTGYPRATLVGLRYPKFQRWYFGMGAINLIILIFLFERNALNASLIFAVPMLIIYLGTCWTTYYHHSGLESDDHFHASHNITNRYYNLVSGNLGYHTAHHLKQGLHWSKLPELHRSIEHLIPPELISDQFPVLGRIFKDWGVVPAQGRDAVEASLPLPEMSGSPFVSN